MKDSKISWCTHTWNPWWGCTEVSPGCDHCYAREFAHNRAGKDVWGKGVPRKPASRGTMLMPFKWDREAAGAETRPTVFCLSMGDILDREVPSDWRYRAFEVMEQCTNLDWLVLSKRPQDFLNLTPSTWRHRWPRNVAAGTSVESQEYVWRAEKLLAVPAPMRFLSVEPQLGPVDLLEYLVAGGCHTLKDGETFPDLCMSPNCGSHIDWLITGAESGPKRRPYDVAWGLSLKEQCAEAGVAFFAKQGPGFKSEAPFGHEELDGVREFPVWRRPSPPAPLPEGEGR